LARGMAARGIDVCVVLGGREVPEVSFEGCARVLLPPVHAADATFKLLLDDDGNPIDDAWRDHRASRLMFEYQSLQPDVLMIELFPFGRRMFGFELLPLLTAARAEARPPHILCSLRDILVGKENPERDRKTIACARACFSHVLVHGDPRLVPIEASFPPMAAIADMLVYTGYVADGPAGNRYTASPAGDGEVIVSVGGGAVGLVLLRAALAARPLSRLADRPWRLITGPNLAAETFAELAWVPPPGVIVERWRPDLPALLATCTLSVSQAGYNTVMDVLTAGARAVLVPFADAGESEQTLRAKVLAERGRVVMVDPAELSAEILAGAIDQALTLPVASVDINNLGIATTAEFVEALCAKAEA
ncbi:MAG: glycosyltransferase, partial [Rhodospirillales bacterium]